MKFNNFKPLVCPKLIDKLYDLVNNFDVYGNISYDWLGGDDVIPIEGNHVSGWIPRQDGGFSKAWYSTFDVDKFFTEKQEKSNKEEYDYFLEHFKEVQGTETIDYDCIDTLELLRDAENDYFQDTVIDLTFMAYVSNGDVIIELVLGYGNNEETLYKKEYTASKFSLISNGSIIQEIYDADFHN